MPSASFSLTTTASPQAAHDYLSDLRNAPEWIDAIEKVERVSDTQYEATVHRVVGSDAKVGYEVVSSERPGSLRTKVDAKQFSGEEQVDISAADGGGSTIEYRMDYAMKGAYKLTTPFTAVVEAASMPSLRDKLRERLDALPA